VNQGAVDINFYKVS